MFIIAQSGQGLWNFCEVREMSCQVPLPVGLRHFPSYTVVFYHTANLRNVFITFIYLFGGICVCHSAYVQVRGQLEVVTLFASIMGIPGIKIMSLDLMAMSLPAEPFL